MLRLLFLLYNFFGLFLGVLASPALLLIVLGNKKYRSRIPQRLGKGLQNALDGKNDQKNPTIWVHALSVGETTSALPLVKGLRANHPNIRLIFSVTTKSGGAIAEKIIAPFVDVIIPAPLDVPCTIQRFISLIRPDLFLLIETDFWPNWLYMLQNQRIPTILVNGRISKKSYTRYKNWSFFFRPLFSCFTLLSMQSDSDVRRMLNMGIPKKRVYALGNLKLDTTLLKTKRNSHATTQHPALSFARDDGLLWICGSTHKGEEEILFQVFKKLKKNYPTLQMLLAPRDIKRGKALVEHATQFGFTSILRTLLPKGNHHDVCILDTIGELAQVYSQADVAFIGGSLVKKGGHNPLEAAVHGIPILFGPHMEDFPEIAAELIAANGAIQVNNTDALLQVLTRLFVDPNQRKQTGESARHWVFEHQGVVERHLKVINQVLSLSK